MTANLDNLRRSLQAWATDVLTDAEGEVVDALFAVAPRGTRAHDGPRIIDVLAAGPVTADSHGAHGTVVCPVPQARWTEYGTQGGTVIEPGHGKGPLGPMELGGMVTWRWRVIRATIPPNAWFAPTIQRAFEPALRRAAGQNSLKAAA